MTQYNQCLPGSLHMVCCNYSFNSCFCSFFFLFFFPNIYFSISKSKYYFQPNVILPLPWPQTQRGERFHLRAVQLSRERSPAAAEHQRSHGRAGTWGHGNEPPLPTTSPPGPPPHLAGLPLLVKISTRPRRCFSSRRHR